MLNLINRTKLSPVFDWESSKLGVKMGDRDNLVTSLSGGNQQKVLIARSFAEKPAVLVLNDPARGIDIGAKLDLYRNLKEFAAPGNGVVFLSSELEEFLNLCSRVLVFRNGSISAQFDPPFDSHVILNAMFGRRASARLPGEAANENDASNGAQLHGTSSVMPMGFDNGRPMPRPIADPYLKEASPMAATPSFILSCPDIAPGAVIPVRFTEENRLSPRLVWAGPPEGTQSFALAITDPDLPEAFNFPRSFAHWLVYNIPAKVRELPEGASGSALLPAGSAELNSDFVTFRIPASAAAMAVHGRPTGVTGTSLPSTRSRLSDLPLRPRPI